MECPAVIVAGFGFSSRAGLVSLRAALAAARAAAGGLPAAALATLADKAGALVPLGAELGLPVIAVTGPLPPTVTDSAASRAARGTGSVAEACALAAAGPGAVLLVPRMVAPGGQATCALARGAGA